MFEWILGVHCRAKHGNPINREWEENELNRINGNVPTTEAMEDFLKVADMSMRITLVSITTKLVRLDECDKSRFDLETFQIVGRYHDSILKPPGGCLKDLGHRTVIGHQNVGFLNNYRCKLLCRFRSSTVRRSSAHALG